MPCPYTHLHLEAACLPKTSPRPSPKGEGGLMARRQGLLSLSFSSVSSASEHMGARNRTPTSPGHQCPGYSKEPPEGDSVGFSRLFYLARAFMPGRRRISARNRPSSSGGEGRGEVAGGQNGPEGQICGKWHGIDARAGSATGIMRRP